MTKHKDILNDMAADDLASWRLFDVTAQRTA